VDPTKPWAKGGMQWAFLGLPYGSYIPRYDILKGRVVVRKMVFGGIPGKWQGGQTLLQKTVDPTPARAIF